jgi:hypothetical protein
MRRLALWMTMSTAAAALGVLAFAAPLSAATTVTAPSDSPYSVTTSASGKPEPFTVTVSGFTPNISVYIEQCSGKPSTDAKWKATLDCDIQSSPAAAITDAKGVATFAATDANHAFHPFVGPSPQGLFTCTDPGAPAPQKGVPNFENCQVRVSSNNISATDDQTFLTMSFPGSSGSTSSSGSSAPPYAVIVVVLIGGGAFFFLRRQRGAA